MSVELSGSTAEAAARQTGSSCTLSVSGMDCSSCADSVNNALRSLEGVQDVQVDVMGGKVKVAYSEGKLARGDLVGAITRVGYEVKDESSARKEIFEVQGMDCADEVPLIEGKLGKLLGVTSLGFDVVGGRLTVEGQITSGEVERAIDQLGMKARLIGATRPERSW